MAKFSQAGEVQARVNGLPCALELITERYSNGWGQEVVASFWISEEELYHRMRYRSESGLREMFRPGQKVELVVGGKEKTWLQLTEVDVSRDTERFYTKFTLRGFCSEDSMAGKWYNNYGTYTSSSTNSSYYDYEWERERKARALQEKKKFLYEKQVAHLTTPKWEWAEPIASWVDEGVPPRPSAGSSDLSWLDKRVNAVRQLAKL